MQNIPELIRSGDLTDALAAYKETAGRTGGKAASGALIGGALGSPFGPAGVAVGATAGSFYGVYKSVDDDRAIAAAVDNSPPQSAKIVDSTHEAIVDVQPIQLAIQSAIEQPQNQTEWLRSTLTRYRDMDAVADSLEQIPSYRTENGTTVHYIRDPETEQVFEVTFGVPVQ